MSPVGIEAAVAWPPIVVVVRVEKNPCSSSFSFPFPFPSALTHLSAPNARCTTIESPPCSSCVGHRGSTGSRALRFSLLAR